MLSKNLSSVRLINGSLRRFLSAQPKTKSKNIEVTTLPSGLVLASIDCETALPRVAVVVRAGSRYEPADNLGVSHVIRSAAGLTTKQYTGFGITRNIEYHGGKLTVSGTRDTISYLLEMQNEDEVVEKNLSMLADTVGQPEFHQWEISDNTDRLKADLSVLEDTPFIQLAEALHKTAFGGGLRNSLYAPKFTLGKHKSEDVRKFHQEFFSGSNTVVVSAGLEHKKLVDLVGQQLVLRSGSSTKDASKYKGGEYHIDAYSPLNYAAIACEGAGLNKPKDCLALGVLQRILGAGPQINHLYGLSQVGRLGQAVGEAVDSKENVSVAAFNFRYEDTGLFGFNLIAPRSENLQKLVKAGIKEFRATVSNINEQDLAEAKANLKNSVLIAVDDLGVQATEAANQLLLNNSALGFEQFNQSIDQLTASDLKSIGSKLSIAKTTLVTLGTQPLLMKDCLE